MQSTETVWINLIGDHPGNIPVKFGQIPISGSREDVVWSFPYIIQCKIVTPGAGSILTPGALFEQLWWRTSRWCYIPNIKALGLVVSDKKIFENCILKNYFLTPWPTYAINWNGLNNFDRGPTRDHSCEVWSKSNKRFQRRCSLKKLLTHAHTHARTPDIEGSQKLTEHFVLRCAKNMVKNIGTSWSCVLCRFTTWTWCALCWCWLLNWSVSVTFPERFQFSFDIWF